MKIREMIIANRADCSGCEACANICPKNAITMTRDAEMVSEAYLFKFRAA